MKVTILGCGGSGGVPLADGTPGGNWGACDPSEPKNRRRRVSILVEAGDSVLLVDASPDLRAQLLDAKVTRLDAMLFTHAHADHCHGLDELRGLVYRRGEPIDAFMDPGARSALTQRFAYAFTSSRTPEGAYRALLRDHSIAGAFSVGSIAVTPFRQGHGAGETTLGFRFGALAYSTDAVTLDEAAFDALAGVEVWIVDALRERPHPTHSHIAQTLAWIDRVKPRRAVLTHMNHEVNYRELLARCPPGVEPAFDGMTIRVEDSKSRSD